MQCQICGMQYVRETGNALHTRMSSHHSDIRTKMLNKQVTAHLINQALVRISGGHGNRESHQDNNMSCRKPQEHY